MIICLDMLHLTQFSTNCSMVQHSQCHLSLSRHTMHPSIIYKRGGKVGGRVGKCVHTPTKSTNTRNHIPANAFHIWSHGRTKQTVEENPTATRYSDQKALTFTHKCLHILNLLSGLMNILHWNINISSQGLMSYSGPDPGELQGLWVVD